MKIKRTVMASVLCAALFVCGCSGPQESQKPHNTDSRTEVGKQKETKKKDNQEKLDMIEPAAYRNVQGLDLEPGSYISVIGKAEDGEFWAQVKAGAERAAADINQNLGYTGKDEVKVTYSGPGEAGSVDEQVNILDEELARYPVALCISVVDTQACGVQFDLAAESGIPIVAFDSGSDYQALMAMVSTDNRATAGEAADHMADLIGKSGEVVLFVNDSKSESAIDRKLGFVERMAEAYPEVTIAETYYMDRNEELRNQIAADREIENPEDITEEEIIDYILEKHPDAAGYYATSGDAVKAVVGALSRAGKEEPAVIGYDANSDEIEGLENGQIDGLILQNPFGMGYAAVVASARAVLSMGNEAYVNTGTVWLTKENLEQYKNLY